MIHFFKKNKWSQLPWDDIKKRSKILVIDDSEFYYKQLFIRDGYNIEQWNDVDDLSKLESGYFDILLLDIQGVGRELSRDEGIGILKHIVSVSPSQIIIAYSNADWSLKYQKEFFDMADCALAKSADYVEFKRMVDHWLKEKFSMNFYVKRALKIIGPHVSDSEKARKMITKALSKRSTEKLKGYLESEIDKKDVINITLQLIQIAIGIAAL